MKVKHFTKKELRRQNTIVVVILLLGFAIALGVHQVFARDLRPVDDHNHQKVEVVIGKGATDKQVAAQLKKQGLVRSAYVFNYYLQTHKSNGVKAGRFVLKKSMSTPQLVSRLQETQYAHKK